MITKGWMFKQNFILSVFTLENKTKRIMLLFSFFVDIVNLFLFTIRINTVQYCFLKLLQIDIFVLKRIQQDAHSSIQYLN